MCIITNALCAACPSVKSKVSALPEDQLESLILKNWRNNARRHSHDRKFVLIMRSCGLRIGGPETSVKKGPFDDVIKLSQPG